MRPSLAVFVAFLLAVVAGQNSLLKPTDAQTTNTTSAITACAVQGGSCSQTSLDSTPGKVLQHSVYAGGCWQADLHVVRYVPADSGDGAPVVATWCR